MPWDSRDPRDQQDPELAKGRQAGACPISKGERSLRRTRIALALFIAGLTVLLILGVLASLARPTQAAGSEAASSVVLLENPYSGALQEAPPLSANLSLRGDGALVHSTLRQTFVNRASRALPGVYIIRLRAGARLESITLFVAGEPSPSEPLNGQRLSTLYDQASANPRLAELLPSPQAVVHAVSLPPVASGQTITLEVRFVEPEGLAGGG